MKQKVSINLSIAFESFVFMYLTLKQCEITSN